MADEHHHERLAGDLTWPEDMGPPEPAHDRPAGDGERWIVSVMSGAERMSHWKVATRCRIVNVMGGSDIDLTQADLAGHVVEITVYSLMGGGTVYVPDRINVEVSGFAFMGANSVKLDNRRPNPGGPTVRLRLISVMGGTDVKRGPKRRLRDRIRRHLSH